VTTGKLDVAALQPWLAVEFGRAQGPGGQNVNKLNTRVTLLFDVARCTLLSDAQRAEVLAALPGRVSRDGRIRVVSQQARTQAANRRLAEARLVELLNEVLRPKKQRRATRPTTASRARWREEKRRHGAVKRLRQTRPAAEE